MLTKKIEVTKLEACALGIIQWFFHEVTIKKGNSTFEKNERICFTQINLKVDNNPNRSGEEISSQYKYKRVRVNAQFLLPEERIREKKHKKDYNDRLIAEIVFVREAESTNWQLFVVGIEFNFVYHGGLEVHHIESFIRSFRNNYLDQISKREDLINLTEHILS